MPPRRSTPLGTGSCHYSDAYYTIYGRRRGCSGVDLSHGYVPLPQQRWLALPEIFRPPLASFTRGELIERIEESHNTRE